MECLGMGDPITDGARSRRAFSGGTATYNAQKKNSREHYGRDETGVVTYHLSVKTCGRGGTADALASGASGGNLVVVQIHSAAPDYNDSNASETYRWFFLLVDTKVDKAWKDYQT